MNRNSNPSLQSASGSSSLVSSVPEALTKQDPDRLLNEGQLARLTNLSVRTLQAWRLRGEGPPFIKIGRSVRYKRGDILDWIDDNAARSTSQININREAQK